MVARTPEVTVSVGDEAELACEALGNPQVLPLSFMVPKGQLLSLCETEIDQLTFRYSLRKEALYMY